MRGNGQKIGEKRFNQPYMNYLGLLNPVYELTKIRQKYDIVVDYIREILGDDYDRIQYARAFRRSRINRS